MILKLNFSYKMDYFLVREDMEKLLNVKVILTKIIMLLNYYHLIKDN